MLTNAQKSKKYSVVLSIIDIKLNIFAINVTPQTLSRVCEMSQSVSQGILENGLSNLGAPIGTR